MELIELQKYIESRIDSIHKRIPDNTQFIVSWNYPENPKIDKDVIYFLWSTENHSNYASLIFNDRVPVQINFNQYKILEFHRHSGKIAELFLPDKIFLDENVILLPFFCFVDSIILHELIEYYCKKYGIEVFKDKHDNIRRLVRYYRKNPKEKLDENKIRSEFNESGRR